MTTRTPHRGTAGWHENPAEWSTTHPIQNLSAMGLVNR